MVTPPNPVYLGPVAHSSGVGNKPIRRIVIHCTVGAEPGHVGAARDTAAYFRKRSAGGSAHYVRDARETVQCAYDSVIAWHAPPNPHSIGYEVCCSLDAQGRGHWQREDHQKALLGAAKDVARLCLAYGVPVRKVSVADLRAGREGICGHVDVSAAFHQSTHWDPGPAFPWQQFMQMVEKEAAMLRRPEPAAVRKFLLRATTANIPPGAERDFANAAEGSDILCVQESQKRRDANFLDAHWTTVQGPAGARSARCSVNLRKDRFQVLGTSFPVLNAANGLTFPGAARTATFVLARDLQTGRKWPIMSAHFVPHADDAFGGITDMPRGPKAVTPAISSILRFFPRTMVGQELVMGDFNIDLDRDLAHRDVTDLAERMNSIGFKSDVQVLGPVPDTHGGDEYDQVWGRFSTGTRFLRHGTDLRDESDHRRRRVTIETTALRGWPK